MGDERKRDLIEKKEFFFLVLVFEFYLGEGLWLRKKELWFCVCKFVCLMEVVSHNKLIFLVILIAKFGLVQRDPSNPLPRVIITVQFAILQTLNGDRSMLVSSFEF